METTTTTAPTIISNRALTAALKITKNAIKMGKNVFTVCYVRDSLAYFTDGYRAVRLPVTCENKFISHDNLETALKVAKVTKSTVDFSALPDDTPQNQCYPGDAIERFFEVTEETAYLSFDAQYLLELCEQALAVSYTNRGYVTLRIPVTADPEQINAVIQVSLAQGLEKPDFKAILATYDRAPVD